MKKEEGIALAQTFLKVSPRWRNSFIARVKQVGKHKDREKLSRIIRPLIFSYRSLSDLSFPTIGSNPILWESALKARDQFLAAPRLTMSHIIEGGQKIRETSLIKKQVIPGGMHSLKAFQRLLLVRLGDESRAAMVSKEARRRLVSYLRNTRTLNHGRNPPEYWLAPGSEKAIPEGWKKRIQLLKDTGFDLDFTTILSLQFRDPLDWLEVDRSGVVRVWNDRDMFLRKAWDISIGSARKGLSPIGGKTLFPKDFGPKQIAEGIKQVLSRPNSRVYVSDSGPEGSGFLVVGQVESIRMVVAVYDSQVRTAFPAWNQEMPPLVGDAYAAWNDSLEALNDEVINFEKAHPTRGPITLEHVRQAYLMQSSRLPSTLAPDLIAWFAPFSEGEIEGARVPSPLAYRRKKQTEKTVFGWIESERILHEIEATLTP